MQVSVPQLAALQQQQARIRNICILAHVDHGKTTLSDHLIASNGLIHPRMVGELRYLDSRDDEQARGITMKSSSISLLHVPGALTKPEGVKSVSDAEKLESGYLVNLIDSPGHVDFCSEVSTAARLSDGALVVVDAVEGVCIQTHAVLRQAWEEKVKPCLMINKVDRLITELRLSPAEAATRLAGIVAHANMVWSAFDAERFLKEADAVLAYESQRAAADEQAQQRAAGSGQVDDSDEADVFQPSSGNVALGSAADGWALTLEQLAGMYAEKLGAKPAALRAALWGDYALLPKERRVVRLRDSGRAGGGGGKLRSMFEQFVLEPLWKAYAALEPGADVAGVLGPIVRGRGLGGLVPERLLAGGDPRQALRSVLRAWLPLSEAVLGMAVAHLPAPPEAAGGRVPALLSLRPGAPAGGGAAGAAAAARPGSPAATQLAEAAAQLDRMQSHLSASSASPDAPLVIYISKMISVPASLVPRRPGEPQGGGGPSSEVFLAFGRVFSGVAREGARVHVLSAAYDPLAPAQQRQSAVLRGLYLMMGRALEALPCVPAGNVLAIAGLESVVLKSATLCSTPCCLPLAPMTFQAAPIVRVAIEPARPGDMAVLAEGLRLLNRADPFVEVGLTDTGEHVLGAAGEVHLETCIKDLRERFAKVELQVSPPLVAFRESVLCAAEVPEGGPPPRGSRVVEAVTPSGAATLRVRAHALPAALAGALDDSADVLRRALQRRERRRQAWRQRREQEAATATGAAAGAQGGATGDTAAGEGTDGACGVSSAAASIVGDEQAWGTTGGAGGAGPLDECSGLGEALTALRQKLAGSLAEAGNKQLSRLLRRAWLLGPRRVGPNLLIGSGSSVATSGISGSGGGSGGSLFDTPPAQVVRSTKQGAAAKPGGALQPHPAAPAADAGGAAGANGAAQQEAAAAAAPPAARWWEVPLGEPEAAELLGFAAGPRAPLSGGGSTAASVDALTLRSGANGAAPNGAGAAPASASSRAVSVAGSEAAAAGTPPPQQLPGGWQHAASSIESGIVAGFQLATSTGPMCDEAMWGVAFELEVRLHSAGGDAAVDAPGAGAAAFLDLQEDVYGPFSGQVMTAAAAALKRAVLEAEPRLVEAQFLCQVQASVEALAGVYAVLGRRRARILREEMREGSGAFVVHAYLPVEASFGLADELRQRCSGAASASLLLSHWERLGVDPFFVPTTGEELEEHGVEMGGPANLARRLVDGVRVRKGLPVEQKVVKVATKQRTLKRNV